MPTSEIKVKMTGDAGQLQRTFDQTEKGFFRLTSAANKARGAIAAAMGATAGGARSLGKAEQIIRSAEGAQVSAESLQTVDSALRIFDVQESADLLKEIQARQFEATVLGDTTPIEAFAKAGIGPQDLVGKSPEQVLMSLIKGVRGQSAIVQRGIAEELQLGGDLTKDRFVAAANDSQIFEQFSKARSRAIGTENLARQAEAQRRITGLGRRFGQAGVRVVGEALAGAENLGGELVGLLEGIRGGAAGGGFDEERANAMEQFRGRSMGAIAEATARRFSGINPPSELGIGSSRIMEIANSSDNLEIKEILLRSAKSLEKLERAEEMKVRRIQP